ncbi:hypothetical protein ZWY2020_008527, partial [Hordeum vulgare]
MAEEERRRRFSSLPGVRWQVDLGILPAAPEASVESSAALPPIRAGGEPAILVPGRLYVSLRRRVLVDPHVPKEEARSPNLIVDNPLSQNPESSWGRFSEAELEDRGPRFVSIVSEDGSYFQTPTCQAMLRRILLMWCLQHPEYGYQAIGSSRCMFFRWTLINYHKSRKLHEDCFNGDFVGVPFPDTDMVFSYKPRKDPKWNSGTENENDSESASRANSLDELDSDTKEIILLSDAYGAEGELGIVLSERFMEHDASSMGQSLCLFNNMLLNSDEEYSFRILCSARGHSLQPWQSYVLHVRSSLLATETDVSCLQRLLNYPTNVDVQKLIEKAQSCKGSFFQQEIKKSLRQKLGLSRTESDPSPVKAIGVNSDARNSARRCLLNTLSDSVGRSHEIAGKIQEDEFPIVLNSQGASVSSAEPSQPRAAVESVTVNPPRLAKLSPLENPLAVPADERATQRTPCATEACSSSGENSPKPFISKFRWLLKLGRPSGEGSMEKGGGEKSDGKGAVDAFLPRRNSNNQRGNTKLAAGDKK